MNGPSPPPFQREATVTTAIVVGKPTVRSQAKSRTNTQTEAPKSAEIRAAVPMTRLTSQSGIENWRVFFTGGF